MADIVYDFEGGLYLNITNDCPCDCVFCIRNKVNEIGTENSMWHDKAPSFDEIKKAIDSVDMSKYTEAVFCGYGEPTCAYDNLIKSARYIKEKYGLKIRLNTNGLGCLVNGRDITKELCSVVDTVSISLNAPNAERYLQITRSKFGIGSFDAIIDFAKKCVEYHNDVRMTVVDILKDEEIKECEKIAKNLGVKFRSREYID